MSNKSTMQIIIDDLENKWLNSVDNSPTEQVHTCIFDVACNLFWSNKCVMCCDIDKLEKTCDQLHIFAQAISLSPKFALYFEQHQMIRELEIYTSNCISSLIFCKWLPFIFKKHKRDASRNCLPINYMQPTKSL